MPNLVVQQLSNPAAADAQKRAQRNTLSTVLLAAESRRAVLAYQQILSVCHGVNTCGRTLLASVRFPFRNTSSLGC
jgi:hypothetical protein